MPQDEHVAVLARGAAVWNAWRAEHDEAPDLSRAALRGLDLTGFDLSRADLRGADLRGTKLCGTDLSGARLETANFFKAELDGADFAGAHLDGAQFLNLLSSSLFGTGKRPSEMRRLPAVQLFLTGRLQNNSLIKISTAGDLIVSKKIPGTVIFMGCASGVMGRRQHRSSRLVRLHSKTPWIRQPRNSWFRVPWFFCALRRASSLSVRHDGARCREPSTSRHALQDRLEYQDDDICRDYALPLTIW